MSEFENDIAVVGMACRFPGANNPEEYWRNLRDGVESIVTYTDEELLDVGVRPEDLHNPNYVKRGAPVEGIEQFDADFFGFSPKEAAIMDPQHRLLLECAWEALEDAGHPPQRFDGAIGVFAGCGMNAYMMFNLLTNPSLMNSVGLFLVRHTGNDKDFLSTRISYCLDLKGPSVNIQTACSTSLVAIHTASQSLLNGECDMALAGGVTLELPHRHGYIFQEGEILSPDGHCRAFDHDSKGTVFGSGGGIVVLRRAQDALDDGDAIHALIKGSAINNDGSGKVGYLAPSVDGQAAAIAEALEVADVNAESITYVESHGTGTPVGDPIEIAALTQAFAQTTERKSYCGIGSVKTNIGHLDTAAGVASFIKVCQSLRHKQLPPSLNFEAPNPEIDFENSPFYVNNELGNWTCESGPLRAGISSLGVGGTNAHVVLEEAPHESAKSSTSQQKWHPLFVSARSKKAVGSYADKLSEFLKQNPQTELADVSHTLLHCRHVFEKHAVAVAKDVEDAVDVLQNKHPERWAEGESTSDQSSVAFLFPGGGTQYPCMAAGLYEADTNFRDQVDKGLELMRSQHNVELAGYLFPDPENLEEAAKVFLRPSLQLPAIFIVEYALAQYWQKYGVAPAAMLGHSMGENTAACVAGVMSFEDCLGLVTLRGRLFETVPEGGMLSVSLSGSKLEELLDDELDLGVWNAPELSVASGPSHALDHLAGVLKEKNIDATRIPINIAAHSKMLEPILGDFGDYLRSIQLNPPEIPFVSNRTGTWITDEQATSPDYWVEHLRYSVHFSQGVETLLEKPGRVLLEVGPGKTLGSLAKMNPKASPNQTVLASLRHQDEVVDDGAFVTKVLGQLHGSGVGVDWSKFYAGEIRRKVHLPTYVFQRQHYWIEPGEGAVQNTASAGQLTRLSELDSWFYQPVWREVGNPPAEKPKEKQTWLVFKDQVGEAEKFCKFLMQHDQHVISVVRGQVEFEKLGESEYRIDSDRGKQGYEALVQELMDDDKIPQRIVHFWLCSEEPAASQWNSNQFHAYQDRGFYSIFFLSQALADEGLLDDVVIDIVSNGMQKVLAEEGLSHPDKALVLGPCRVLPHEFPALKMRSIDIVLDDDHVASRSRWRFSRTEQPNNTSGALANVILADSETKVVALRNGKLYERTHERVTPPNTDVTPLIKQSGVYLITGGLGGIGFVVAEKLAQHGTKLVLIGRTLLPKREDWTAWLERHEAENKVSKMIRNVQHLEELGAQVMVEAADVSNIEEMEQVIQLASERFGAINGVVHAAGLLRDGLLQMKTQADVEEVMQPKVLGLGVLDRLLAGKHLDFMVLFSSTSTVTGPPGQTDYVGANAFLNAYANSRNGGDFGRVISLNWGIWNEVGMAMNLSRELRGEVTMEVKPGPEPKHVLFSAHEVVGNGNIHLLNTFSPDTHWLFDEHRTADGQALMPGTGFLQLVQAAMSELNVKKVEISDVSFLRPLQINDGEKREVRIVLRPEDDGYTVEIESLPSDDGSGNWELHVQASVTGSRAIRKKAEPVSYREIVERCNKRRTGEDPSGIRGQQEEFLNFGPRWRVLHQACYGEEEAIATLQLPDQFTSDVGQFDLHPGLLDIATGFAMELIDGYTGRELWVPISYGRVSIHATLPTRIYSWVRNAGKNRATSEIARFDIDIMDEDGNVIVEIKDFAIHKLAGGFGSVSLETADDAKVNVARVANTVAVAQQSEAQQTFQRMLALGITPKEGGAAFEKALEFGVSEIIVTSMDLDALVKDADEAAHAVATQEEISFARPELDNDYQAPRTKVEKNLVALWERLLGVDQVGVKDGFFDLGGHSLIAVRLFNEMRKQFGVELALSTLFEAPTIEALAAMIDDGENESEEDVSVRRPKRSRSKAWTTIVPIQRNGTKTPIFCAAGMGGNPMNLRHLALHLGMDQPFYGLQHRGVDGRMKPHDSVEAMAAEYLGDIKKIQSEGPYILGGFSGGGVAAFEVAQQLKNLDEEVALLFFLDSFCPTLPNRPLTERRSLHMRRLKSGDLKSRVNYLRRTIKGRTRSEFKKIRDKLIKPMAQVMPYELRNENIRVAWLDAEKSYTPRAYDGETVLFRIERDVNRQATRRVVDHYLGWKEYIDVIEVKVVPGNHENMCKEPYVLTLANELASVLDKTANENHKFKSAA